MSAKISLPHHLVVSQWKEEKVIRWLKKVHLDDCIPAFKKRDIDGLKLLELTEQKLFTYQDVKIKHRKQIAKCVQECKSQASNAKRIAKSLKHNNGSHSHPVESNGACDSGDDSDDWGSDFEDSEDEVANEKISLEENNNTIIHSVPGIETNLNSYPMLQTTLVENKSIPKPPDVPVISKSINSSTGFRNHSMTTIPRPPLKRPPSQPPPPPVLQVTSHSESQEDYEIPIVPTTSSLKDGYSFSDSASTNFSSLSNESSVIETYEIVEPPEENYEIVDAPITAQSVIEKPIVPPRHMKYPGGSISPPPPPLPQKPPKLKDNFLSERVDGVRSFSRPKLPVKADNDAQAEIIQPSSLPSNVGFISSLIGRKPGNSTLPSPKAQHKSNESVFTNPTSGKFPSDSVSSGSSLSDKDGPSLLDLKKMQPLPPLPIRGTPTASDDTVSSMATRPLPPVPLQKDDDKSNKQEIHLCPWFHEMEREDAEDAVKKLNEAGSFVVRPSRRAGKDNPYSLTVLHEDKLFHLNIRQRSDNTFALGKEKEKEKTFATVTEMIAFHLNEPILLKNRGESAGKTILRKYPDKL